MQYDHVADYLGVDDPSGRHECPLCGSSDGLGIDPEQGDTGSAHCFSCGFGEREPGTGLQLYYEVEGVDMSEACEAFGVETSDLSSEVAQKEKQAPKPPLPDYTETEWQERCRVWLVMLEEEVRLRAEYRRRRNEARQGRDREAFDRWQAKLDELHEHVLERERAHQWAADRMDAHTDHID